MSHQPPITTAGKTSARDFQGRLPLARIATILVLCVFGVSKMRGGENVINNPGFEDGTESWGSFIPQESENKGCEFLISKTGAHSGNACAQLKSIDFARFSCGPNKPLKGEWLRPGDRCRLTYWIRADKGLQAKAKPSFVVRIFVLDDQGQNNGSNMAIFVGLNGHTTVQNPSAGLDLSSLGVEIPTQWTKVESVFMVPTDLNASRLGKPEFFATYTLGSVFLDDIVLEKVGNDVPLSSVTKKP